MWLIEMTQYYFTLYSHMNMYRIFKDFSSYVYSLDLASFCIWLTNHTGFFPGVYPSIKFSDFCSLLDAANIMCPTLICLSKESIRTAELDPTGHAHLRVFFDFTEFPTVLGGRKTVPEGMTWTVGYLNFRGGQGNACHHQTDTFVLFSPSGRLTMLPAFTCSLVGTAK